MNGIKLKPCPFCGGEGKVAYEDWVWCIRCENCFARSEGWSSGNASKEDLYYTIQESVLAAVNAWNRRVNDENA